MCMPRNNDAVDMTLADSMQGNIASAGSAMVFLEDF